MNKLILLFGVLVCLFAVNARHLERTEDSEDEGLLKPREHHRRRRWQSSYDYPPPSFYYERRDDRYSQDIQNIYKLLEDISNYVRRTPAISPPPQPVYIPFPIYNASPACNPANTTDTKLPDFPKKNAFTDNMDQNRNWGFAVPEEEGIPADENDGARPISFEPLVPKQLMKRPAPAVEHGSQQVFRTSPAPKQQSPLQFVAESSLSSPSRSSVPGMCNAAVLTCCGFSGDTAKQRQCFGNMGCSTSYDVTSCTPDSIQLALDSFRLAYSPKN